LRARAANGVVAPLQMARLAARDLWHQRLASSVLILALAAVLAPLLVLFGLKFGVVDNLLRALVQDPANREIRLIGHGHFDREWFERMAAREDIAFVVPRTRGAAANMELRPEDGDRTHATVELIPSGPGDPLLEGYAAPPADRGSVVISARTARHLGARLGDRLKGSVRRRSAGQWSRVQVPLRVSGVIPDSRFARHGAFVVPGLLTAVEDYRDGYAVPELGWGDGEPFAGERYFSGFRLYVRSLDDVAPVRDGLSAEGRGFEVSTRAKAIAEVKRLDRYLTSTFFMIALVGVVGYLLSFAAAMWVNVERRRRELSVLQLLGFRAAAITLFPVVQSAAIALCGGLLAIVLFWVISGLINGYFAREGGGLEGLCRLLPAHLAVALVATLLCGIASSGLAAFRTTRVEASRGLREL
jgi:putative ABC transport system permease protein